MTYCPANELIDRLKLLGFRRGWNGAYNMYEKGFFFEERFYLYVRVHPLEKMKIEIWLGDRFGQIVKREKTVKTTDELDAFLDECYTEAIEVLERLTIKIAQLRMIG